jgi:hypothetical protein
MILALKNLLIDPQFLADRAFDFDSKELKSLANLARKGLIKLYVTYAAEAEIRNRIIEKSKIALSHLSLGESGLLLHIPQFRYFIKSYDKTAVARYFIAAFEQFKSDGQIRVISDDDLNRLEWSSAASMPTWGDLHRMMDLILRQEESAREEVYVAERFIAEKRAEIEQFIAHKLYYSGYLGRSADLEVEIIDAQIIDVTMERYYILSVDQRSFIYNISFSINGIFGFQSKADDSQLQGSNHVPKAYETVYQHHLLTEAICLEINLENSIKEPFKISADMPDEIEVFFDDGEYIDWPLYKRKDR